MEALTPRTNVNMEAEEGRYKVERATIWEEKAKEIVAGIDLVTKPARYKTIYLGLKLNHAHNVAIVHPLMFAIRRIIYALSIVLLPTASFSGIWIMLIGTLVMLGYATTEWQWNSRLITSQHIFNEITTYIVCLYLLMYSNFVSVDVRVGLGYSCLGLFMCFLVYNSIIMMWLFCINLRLFLKRMTTYHRRMKLRLEIQLMMMKVKAHIAQVQLSARHKEELD